MKFSKLIQLTSWDPLYLIKDIIFKIFVFMLIPLWLKYKSINSVAAITSNIHSISINNYLNKS